MSTVVQVPSCELIGPAKAFMTGEDLKRLLEKFGRLDPEAGHSLTDNLMRAALTAIRDGHGDPRALAEAVLVAESAEFPRWMA